MRTTRGSALLLLLLAGCEPTTPWEGETGETLTFVVQAADIPLVDLSTRRAYGFDLDDRVGFCGVSDFVSITTGEAGVDNQVAGELLPALYAASGVPSVGTQLTDAIAAGDFLLGLEIEDVDDMTNDRSVNVRLVILELPAGATLRLDGSAPAPDQEFIVRQVLATIPFAAIVEGRLELDVPSFPLWLPLEGGDGLTLNLSRFRLAGDVSREAISEGNLGAYFDIGEAVGVAEWIAPGVVTAETIEDFVRPDVSAGGSCRGVSMGMSFRAVPATF